MRKMTILAVLTSALLLSGCSSPQGSTPEEKKAAVDELHSDVLKIMAEKYPEIKTKVRKSSGYGVFSNLNINVIIASMGSGYGLVVNNDSREKTYMKMALGGLGLGLGAKDFRQLIVFNNDEAINKFVEKGWEFGAHADAAAQSGEKGGSANAAGDISSGMDVYQVTKNGLALQATVSAAKYWKDDELNQ